MLEELFNLVKGAASNTVVNNPDVPNEQNNAVIAEATNTVAGGLRNIVAGGGAESLVSMFQGANSGQAGVGGLLKNPIVSMMIGHFANKLISNYNIGGAQANNVAANLIPSVISGLVNKTNDPNNSAFSLENLLGSITGNKQGSGGLDIGGIVSKLTGGGSGGGGGLLDIASQLARGAQQQQQNNGTGGLLNLIKGFIR